VMFVNISLIYDDKFLSRCVFPSINRSANTKPRPSVHILTLIHISFDVALSVSICVLLVCVMALQHVNASYKTNLQQLNGLVLVKFDNDTMVEPRESEVSVSVSSVLPRLHAALKSLLNRA